MNTRNKYVTANDIYMRIISTFKSKAAEISKIEVVRWCSECITDYLKDPVGLVKHSKYCVYDGVNTILSRGICWNTAPNPTIANNTLTDSTGMDEFTAVMTDLLPNTTYYVRAYATNSIGTSYGTQQTFTTTAGTISITTKVPNAIQATSAGSGGVIVRPRSLNSANTNMIYLPTDIFKLEGVYNENNGLCSHFTYQGDYLIFSDNYMPEKVYIDYYSLPVDETTGFPLIKKGYEPACYAYCVYKMFEEDATAIPPRVAQWRWLQIVQDKEWEIEAAHRSWDGLTDNDLMEIHNFIISRDYLEQVYGISSPMLDGGSMYGENENL